MCNWFYAATSSPSASCLKLSKSINLVDLDLRAESKSKKFLSWILIGYGAISCARARYRLIERGFACNFLICNTSPVESFNLKRGLKECSSYF